MTLNDPIGKIVPAKTALAPCPFCGSTDICVRHLAPRFHVECLRCGGSISARFRRMIGEVVLNAQEEAERRWNRRAPASN